MDEEWRELKEWKGIDFSGYCMISNMGNVKTIDRVIHCSNGTERHAKSKPIHPYKDEYGYLRITLKYNKHPMIHQLVMLLFNPNPNPDVYTQINHIDENKENNRLDNLEWCTAKQNCNYGTRNERVTKSLKDKFVPIVQLDLNGNIINTYTRKEDIGNQNPDFCASSVTHHVNHDKNIYHNYFWIRKPKCDKLRKSDLITLINTQIENKRKVKEEAIASQRRKIIQLSVNGDLIKSWDSVSEAAKNFNSLPQCINLVLRGKAKTFRGYFWLLYDVYKNMSEDDIATFIKSNNKLNNVNTQTKKESAETENKEA